MCVHTRVCRISINQSINLSVSLSNLFMYLSLNLCVFVYRVFIPICTAKIDRSIDRWVHMHIRVYAQTGSSMDPIIKSVEWSKAKFPKAQKRAKPLYKGKAAKNPMKPESLDKNRIKAERPYQIL